MKVIAQLNNLRISPRKVRLVARVIKGADALVAKHQLGYLAKGSSRPISKLLSSALANAHNNFHLVKENLFIKDVIVNEGQKLKRFRPKGFGMASPIEKKTSRVKIVLEEKVAGLKSHEARDMKHIAEEEAKKEESRELPGAEAMAPKIRPEVKKEIGRKGGIFGKMGGLGRKFFRRKAI